MIINFLHWIFSLAWWGAFKTVCHIGAPIVCVVGIVWYLYDRFTGGI